MMSVSKAKVFTWNWWRETETPRWAIVLGAVSMLALSVFANMWSTVHVENVKRVDANRSEQIRLLLNDMGQFQSSLAAYEDELTSTKKVSPQTRAALLKNLNDQYSRARQIEALVPSDADDLALLRRSITNLIDVLPTDPERSAMLKFWSAVSKVTVSKNKLNLQLQNSI